MPTFGKTSGGATAWSKGANQIRSCLYTAPEDGLAMSMTINLTASSGINRKLLLYEPDGTLLGATETKSNAVGEAEDTYTFATPVPFTAGGKRLGINSDGLVYTFHDAGDANQELPATATFCSEGNVTWGSGTARAIYIYCTYTPVVAGLDGGFTFGRGLLLTL